MTLESTIVVTHDCLNLWCIGFVIHRSLVQIMGRPGDEAKYLLLEGNRERKVEDEREA